MHHITAQTLRMCSSAGNRSTGGTVIRAKNPPTLARRGRRNSRYQRMTSGVCSIGQNVGPAMTVSPM